MQPGREGSGGEAVIVTSLETMPAVLSVGSLTLHVEPELLEGPRGEVRLSGSHFRVLARLMRKPGALVTRLDLISELYPDADDEGEDAEGCLRQVIMSLRRALTLLGCGKRSILITEVGIGHAILDVRMIKKRQSLSAQTRSSEGNCRDAGGWPDISTFEMRS